MDDGTSTWSRTTGSVVLQVGALELLARYSMNSGRATSVLSSLHDFKSKESEQTGGKQWNWKYLRDQFYQKDLEGLYRKYDEKLRETLIYIYVSLLVIFSTIHIILVIVYTYNEQIQWQSTYLSMAMYVARIAVPVVCFCKCFYKPLKRRWFWIPILYTFILTADLVMSGDTKFAWSTSLLYGFLLDAIDRGLPYEISKNKHPQIELVAIYLIVSIYFILLPPTDVAVAIFASFEGMLLRPAYSTMALLSVYIFLPMRNNFLAIFLGVLVSIVYTFVFAFFTYYKTPNVTIVVACELIYLIGVNLMGIYFRLMNEIITRRSFLDRRACVESTLRLKFVKDQEERLMLSILPEHIVSKVRQDIRNMFMNRRSPSQGFNKRSFRYKPFSQLYVEEHENVSILYADVVNYTKISTTLSPLRMVELLNELFGRFDEASEEHDVLRIKFLGDCYYCVSGIPKPNKQHAMNCVDLGLEMIHIIKNVREKRALNIDMRIGVHSGKILSGLIGIRKWQFDIWSKDVTIANKMESTGKVGKVHITKQTLDLLLEYAREYIIEPNFASQNDPFIMKNKLQTFLLSRPQKPQMDYKPFRRASVGFNKIIPTRRGRRSENRNSSSIRRTTAFMDENLVEYQQMLKAADAQMAKEIEDMSNGKDQFKQESRLNRFTLMYKKMKLEKSFLLQPDPLFKYYITCCLLMLCLIMTINGLTTNWFYRFTWYAKTLLVMLLFILILMQPVCWFLFVWSKYKGIDEPRNKFVRWIYDLSLAMIKCPKIRTGVYIFLSLALAGSSMVNVIACTDDKVEPLLENIILDCASSWHVTQCWSLALLLNFLFSRVFFIFKWIVAGGMTLFYLWIVWEIKTSLFSGDSTWNVGLDPRVSHTLSVVIITITLYWIDRTTEYRNRLDHLWQIQLSEEQEEAETMLKVNNMLLENILPAHVVQVYLDLNRSLDELYYEKYDNVAVMFASLTDYKLGLEDNAEMNDKFLLRILDEVISDFDRLLLTGASVHKVEKIKMAGWTYMAACGLDPSRRDSFDSYASIVDRSKNTPYNRTVVVTMVEFAAAMMMQLQNFNRGSFQSFEGLNLRIGISNGEVAAGVVGSLKPLYDIWGNAVNMASRMDSTGESGKIQVTENTAKILEECGIITQCRGEVFIKGRGYIKTFFVPLDEDFNLIKQDICNLDYHKHNEKGLPYKARTTLMSGTSAETGIFESTSQFSTYHTGDAPLDYDEDDFENFKRLNRSVSELVDMKNFISASQKDNQRDSYTDNDIMETRC